MSAGSAREPWKRARPSPEKKKYLKLDMKSLLNETEFNALWSDVYDIAKSRCLKTDFSLQNGGATGGDVGAYEPTQLKDLRSYENKYGGLSASGWNGAV